jgi:hypothetical protein
LPCAAALQALAQWQLLQQQWCIQGQLTTLQQLDAIEAAAWLLQELVAQQAQQQLLLDEDVEQLQQKTKVNKGTSSAEAMYSDIHPLHAELIAAQHSLNGEETAAILCRAL